MVIILQVLKKYLGEEVKTPNILNRFEAESMRTKFISREPQETWKH